MVILFHFNPSIQMCFYLVQMNKKQINNDVHIWMGYWLSLFQTTWIVNVTLQFTWTIYK